MAIEELVKIVRPPERPLETGSQKEWEAVEASLGVRLPQDLHQLCAMYGSGEFGSIIVFNPFSSGYRRHIDELVNMYRSLKMMHGDEIPYAIYPDASGLFPCGATLDGGTIFYLTAGGPDSWPLILLGHVYQWQRLDMSISTFLATACSGQLACIFWDSEWRNENRGNVGFLPRPSG
jgi:hypothetical protein